MKIAIKALLVSGFILALLGCPSPTDSTPPGPPPPTYSITFDGNEQTSGDEPVDTTAYLGNAGVTIPGNPGHLAKTGYKFNGWSLSASGTGTAYLPGSTFVITDNTTLYARWIADATPTYTISYYTNQATSGTAPVDACQYISGQKAVIMGNSGNLSKTPSVFDDWNTVAAGTGAAYRSGEEITVTGDMALYAQWGRTFNVMNLTDNSWYTVDAGLWATGNNVKVYVEPGASVTGDLAREIAAEFDANIYGKITDNFGSPLDVNEDGKVTLLLLNIRDGYVSGGSYIGGFFQNAHMYSVADQEHSNESDMLFLDTYPQEAGSDDFYDTVAHEFQHLINFSNTVAKTDIAQDLWINEGLSAGAEYVYTGTLSDSRINYYNSDPYGSLINGNNFYVWNGYWEYYYPNTVLDNYATVYLFFQWLRIQASNGTGIYKEILSSDYRDYRAVTEAATRRIDSSLSNWETLLSTWLVANVYYRPSGLLGYKGIIKDLSRRVFVPQGDLAINLFPGEAIGSMLNEQESDSSYTPPAGSGENMRYRGLSISTFQVDDTAPYSGQVCMIFNANPDNTATYESGFAASAGMPAGSSFVSSVTPGPLPTNMKVDVQFNPDGTARNPVTGANKALKPLSKQEWSRGLK